MSACKIGLRSGAPWCETHAVELMTWDEIQRRKEVLMAKPDLIERLRAESRLMLADLNGETMALLREAADRIEELERQARRGLRIKNDRGQRRKGLRA